MTERDRQLDELLRDWAKDRPRTSEHPEESMFAAYLRGELEETEADGIREHFATCAECARLGLELQEFLEPTEPDRWRESETEDWHRLKREFWPPDAPAKRSGFPWLVPWAAVTSIATAALVVLLVRSRGETASLRSDTEYLHGQLAESRDAIARLEEGLLIGDLVFDPQPISSRNTDSPAIIRLAKEQGLVLVLTPETRASFLDYRITLHETARIDKPIISVKGVRPLPLVHQFTVRLPPDKLSPGRYTVELAGLSADGWTVTGRFALEIELQ